MESRAQRFGWTTLTLFAALGLLLEAAHGFKVSAVLDDELTRLLLRLGHTHGVGLSLVVLMWSVAAPEAAQTPATWRALAAGAVAIPLGFLFGAVGHPEGDPSFGIVLVPIGALALLYALSRTAYAAWR